MFVDFCLGGVRGECVQALLVNSCVDNVCCCVVVACVCCVVCLFYDNELNNC